MFAVMYCGLEDHLSLHLRMGTHNQDKGRTLCGLDMVTKASSLLTDFENTLLT